MRTDNRLTQDELAEKILVTRTAISKWETNKGYPSIDSLKELSNLFSISIDELIADDIENKRLLDAAKSRKHYWYAIGCLGVASVSAVASYFVKIPHLNLLSILGVIGYVIFGILPLYEFCYPLVMDVLSQQIHQQFVIQGVKALRQVHQYCAGISLFRVPFHLPAIFTADNPVQLLGFNFDGSLTLVCCLIFGFCSSGQSFAAVFLQIPPHDEHP